MEMTLQYRIKEAFPEYTDDQFSNWCSDLHVLYSTELDNWLKENYDFCNIRIHKANVKWHPWFGKRFFDIPFAFFDEYYKSKKDA